MYLAEILGMQNINKLFLNVKYLKYSRLTNDNDQNMTEKCLKNLKYDSF